MQKDFKTQKLKIKLGPVDLNFPILFFGQGQKTIGLVVGLHGVETSGFFVVEKLFEKRKTLKNKVKVILGANPSGLLIASRFNGLDLPMDVKDPNRAFPGNPKGNVQTQINNLILDEIRKCDFVLDIHNYSNFGGIFSLLALEGINESDFTGNLKSQALQFLSNLKTQFCFFVDAKQAQQRGFAGTLNESLNKLKIPNLCLETPGMEFLSDVQIENLTGNLIFAINNIGKLSRTAIKLPIMLNTEIVRSQKAGVFTPLLTPPCPIVKGQIVGKLFDPFTGSIGLIKSPDNGLLFIVKRKNFVRVGEFLMEIGQSTSIHRCIKV